MSTPTLQLPPERSSPSAARRWVRPMVEGRVDDVEGALLCVSEIVTNAVLHAGTDCEVTVDVTDDRVRIAVRDYAPDLLPVPRELSRTSSTGRGLHILAGCTDAWGVERNEHAKTVWFELGLEDDEADQSSA
jgi:anti-sigma regulatory factor (Ser/Thr protein kinase)